MQLIDAIFNAKFQINDTQVPRHAHLEFVLDLLQNFARQQGHVPGPVQFTGRPDGKDKGQSVFFSKFGGQFGIDASQIRGKGIDVEFAFAKGDMVANRIGFDGDRKRRRAHAMRRLSAVDGGSGRALRIGSQRVSGEIVSCRHDVYLVDPISKAINNKENTSRREREREGELLGALLCGFSQNGHQIKAVLRQCPMMPNRY